VSTASGIAGIAVHIGALVGAHAGASEVLVLPGFQFRFSGKAFGEDDRR
jgi:hypothetical protein